MSSIAPHKVIDCCRSCGSSDVETVVEFGTAPIADNLRDPFDRSEEYSAPLTLGQCQSCGLTQILETVEPAILFGSSYPYYSSVSQALVDHFSASARQIIKEQDLGAQDLVLEVASNDGYMLQTFHDAGIQVLGVDPASGPAKVAQSKGIDTLNTFFTEHLAEQLVADGKRARVILANNVLAHVADTVGTVRGMANVLADDGLIVAEFPYLKDLLDHREFDTIYHQHLLYFSVTSAKRLFEGQGLVLNDVERIASHGGSLRVRVSKTGGMTQRTMDLLTMEAAIGLDKAAYFETFKSEIAGMKQQTRATIDRLKGEGKTIIGYGAAAKATTLLHFFGLTKDDIGAIVDKSAWKQGLQMPVTGIPIHDPVLLQSQKPDVVLILAWNFAREIIAENKAFLEAGGTFMVPVPELREVGLEDVGISL